MKNSSTSTLIAIAATLAVAGVGASATTINVDFNATGGGTGTYTGTAAAPDTGTYWNGISTGVSGTATTTLPPSGPLLASDGITATTVTVSLSNYGSFDAGGTATTLAPALLNDFVYDINSTPSTPSPATFSIAGLTPGAKYSLYLYSQNGGYDNAATTFGISSNPRGGQLANPNVTNTMGDTTFKSGVNYLLLPSTTANSSGVISGSFVTNDATNFAAFDGFQLVSTPEPASLSLLGLGTLLLARRRRA